MLFRFERFRLIPTVGDEGVPSGADSSFTVAPIRVAVKACVFLGIFDGIFHCMFDGMFDVMLNVMFDGIFDEMFDLM